MAGGGSEEIPKLTGIYKYFNSYTIRGRANTVYAVYGCLILGYIYYKMKKTSSKDKDKSEK